MSKPKGFWVPEDYVYATASECLLAHPEQAAQLMRDDIVHRKLAIAIDALKLYVEHYPGDHTFAREALKQIEGENE